MAGRWAHGKPPHLQRTRIARQRSGMRLLCHACACLRGSPVHIGSRQVHTHATHVHARARRQSTNMHITQAVDNFRHGDAADTGMLQTRAHMCHTRAGRQSTNRQVKAADAIGSRHVPYPTIAGSRQVVYPRQLINLLRLPEVHVHVDL